MKDLIIKNQDWKKLLPKVSMYFDEGIFEIQGEIYDYLEDVMDYLQPFFEKTELYIQNPEQN